MFPTYSPITPQPKKYSDKYLIVGLGNPGREYRLNRHNVGFILLDRLAQHYGLPGFTKRQGNAVLTTGTIGDAPVVLVKPQTYMNLSGEAVGSLFRFYEIHRDRLLVCVDDIDIPVGTLRLRARGTSGGQRGLQSVIDHVGTQSFPRLRVGIGRPQGARAPASHVLQDMQGDELELISGIIDKAVEAIETYIRGGIVLAMSRYNGPLGREG